MTLQEQFQDLFTKLRGFTTTVGKYLAFTAFIVFMCAYGFLVWRINQLSGLEPTPDQVSSELKTVVRPKVDKVTLDRIQQLQDQNIEVKSLFQQARQNPFAE